jgi:hypothetical protein
MFDQVALYRTTILGSEALTLIVLWWLLARLGPYGVVNGPRLQAFAVCAWNPVVLFDLVGSTHNDAVMLALLMLGTAAVVLGRTTSRGWLGGIVLMTLGGLVKYASGLAAAIWTVAWMLQANSLRARILRLAVAGGCALALTGLAWRPWLSTADALQPLGQAAGGRLVLNSAPDVVALTVADRLLVPAGVDTEAAQSMARFWMRALTRAIFGLYFAAELWRLWSRGQTADVLRRAIAASVRVLLVLPLLVLTWVWSWYFSWPLSLAALLGLGSRLTRLTVAYTLVVLPIVYAHQYLNERLSGAFVLGMALFPLVVVAVHSGREEEKQA